MAGLFSDAGGDCWKMFFITCRDWIQPARWTVATKSYTGLLGALPCWSADERVGRKNQTRALNHWKVRFKSLMGMLLLLKVQSKLTKDSDFQKVSVAVCKTILCVAVLSWWQDCDFEVRISLILKPARNNWIIVKEMDQSDLSDLIDNWFHI